jgi:hypothetical protein
MYDALDDGFLNVHTWTSLHPLDRRRFFVVLSRIVRNPDFSSVEMRGYIARKYYEQFGLNESEELDHVSEYLFEAAATVREFLEANGEIG